MRSANHNKLIDMALQLLEAIRTGDLSMLPDYFRPDGGQGQEASPRPVETPEVTGLQRTLRKAKLEGIRTALAAVTPPWATPRRATGSASSAGNHRSVRGNSATSTNRLRSRLAKHWGAGAHLKRTCTRPKAKKYARGGAKSRSKNEGGAGPRPPSNGCRGARTTINADAADHNQGVKEQPTDGPEDDAPAHQSQEGEHEHGRVSLSTESTQTRQTRRRRRRTLPSDSSDTAPGDAGPASSAIPRNTVAAEDL